MLPFGVMVMWLTVRPSYKFIQFIDVFFLVSPYFYHFSPSILNHAPHHIVGFTSFATFYFPPSFSVGKYIIPLFLFHTISEEAMTTLCLPRFHNRVIIIFHHDLTIYSSPLHEYYIKRQDIVFKKDSYLPCLQWPTSNKYF
jgi:hypothetical protein